MRRLTAFLLAAGVMALGSAPGASADDPILYTVTYVEVMPPATAQAAALLRQYREAGRKDQGNLRLEVVQRLDRSNQFVILGAWRSREAYQAHAATASAADLRVRLQPHLASPNDERLHSALSVGSAPSAAAAVAIYVVTHVDVIPPRKDESLGVLRHLAEESRREPGNLRFDVVQQTNRPNHFSVVEVWQDRAAFDAHGMAAPARRFRERLAPMSGSLYDERLYAILS
jgi:quinol monooxygenase YgiN